MAVSLFGITYTDIESALEGFDLSDRTTEVLASITRNAALWNAQLRRQGYDPATIEAATTDTLYSISQLFIILRVAAEIGRRFTHQDPELSKQRDERASGIAQELRDNPESMSETWDVNEQRGSFRSDRILTARTPGTSRTRKPWGSVF